jgi:hypothetical protein
MAPNPRHYQLGFLIAGLLLCTSPPSSAAAQETSGSAALLAAAPTPRDLASALAALDTIFDANVRQWIDTVPEAEMIRLHFTAGMFLRNAWGLWKGSPLSLYFNSIGIQHPDDMTGILFTSYWRQRHSQPLRVEDQVRGYQDYWAHVRQAPAPPD